MQPRASEAAVLAQCTHLWRQGARLLAIITVALHRIRLTRARLPVGKERAVDTLGHVKDNWLRDAVINICVGRRRVESLDSR